MSTQHILFILLSISSSLSIFNGLEEIKKRNEYIQLKRDIIDIKKSISNIENKYYSKK